MSATENAVPIGTLKQVKLSDITVGERFRTDLGDIEELAESIRQKGVLQPITLDKHLNLLAGGRRYAAATLAGLEKIPALLRETADELDAREIELIENIHRKDFGWLERTSLIARIDALYRERDQDWSSRKTGELLGKSLGNVSRSMQLAKALDIIPELREQKTADDAFKLLKKFEENALVGELASRHKDKIAKATVTQTIVDEATGEESTIVYTAENTDARTMRLVSAERDYMIGDLFEMPPGPRPDIIECDPPYGIDLSAVKSSKDSVDSTVHGYKEVATDDYQVFLDKLAVNLYERAADNCWLIFWFGPTWHYEVRESLKRAGWKVDDIPAIWDKFSGQTLQPELYLARTYEPFFLCRKGNPVLAQRGQRNVFSCLPEEANLKYHPTQRPVILIKKLLEVLGLPGQTVFVPFLGSGTTLRVCYTLNMSGYGYDLNPSYKDRFLLAVDNDYTLEQLKANEKE